MKRSGPRPAGRRRAGFTLLEAIMALALFSLMAGGIFSLVTEVSRYSANADTHHQAQSEAYRGVARLTEILRESGWSTLGGIDYPRVISGGEEIQFRILDDLDGNGYAFDASSGEIEWASTVFSVRVDSSEGTLCVYRGATKVRTLCRFINQALFRTIDEDPALDLEEVAVTLVAQKEDERGLPVSYVAASSIHLRN